VETGSFVLHSCPSRLSTPLDVTPQSSEPLHQTSKPQSHSQPWLADQEAKPAALLAVAVENSRSSPEVVRDQQQSSKQSRDFVKTDFSSQVVTTFLAT
jgi:hypothetical protein